jgi:uncharacterized protein (TIGR02118 family)
MLKLIMCVTRLPHLTREEFDRHWIEQHAPLVRSYQTVLGIRAYVQTVPLQAPALQAAASASRGTLPVAFDGCAELWWDSLEAHLAARNTAAGQQALQALVDDEKRFVDLSRSQLWYGYERTII